MVSSTPRPHFTPGKDPVPILQEDGWAPGPVWTDGKSRPHRNSMPDRPARSQSLCRLSYPAHSNHIIVIFFSVTNSTASPYFVFFILFFCMSTSFNDSDIRKDIQRLKFFIFVKIYPRPCIYLYTLLK